MAVCTGTGAVVGIDLGTTFSSVARMDEFGRVDVIRNIDGHTVTPSIVFFDDENVLVGREAAKALLVEPERGAECFKRDIGLPAFSSPVNGEAMRPERLSAIVLTKLKQDAEEVVGPISDAVITVPAFFDDGRRKATEDAGAIAGLNVMKIINEPTSAAIWYAFESKPKPMDGETFLVYDLGGGTFDATLMRARGDNEFETIGTDGEVVLGGRDWDERLLDYVVEEFKREAGVDPTEDPAVYQELVQRVEECKRTLSKRASAAVAVAYGGHRLRVPVSREKFEELTTDLLARTQSTLELIIDEAQMEWSQISRVLLVGGSSHMPMVQKMLKRVTGMDPEAKGEFELAVARGAAVQAAIMQSASGSGAAVPVPKIVVRDVNSHSLGVEVVDDAGAPANFPVIPKNSPIPCSVSQQFETVGISGPNSKISITVLEGEASDPSACIHVGRCVITDLPPGLPAGSPVKVTFSYSEDGRVEVEAEAVAVGLKAHAEIQRQNPLHPEQLEQEVKVMTKLSVL